VPSEALIIILDGFLHYISELNDFMPIKEVTQNVFRNLLSQSPDLEMLEAKFQAWKKVLFSLFVFYFNLIILCIIIKCFFYTYLDG